jgi:hypothetical protein
MDEDKLFSALKTMRIEPTIKSKKMMDYSEDLEDPRVLAQSKSVENLEYK